MGDSKKYGIGEKIALIVDRYEYMSKILSIGEEEEIIVYTPSINGSKLRLEDDKKYSVIFYLKDGLYKADVMLSDEYTEDGIAVTELEIISELERYQRREFYRIDYYTEIEYKILEICDEEGNDVKYSGEWNIAKLSNISGGGMKFTSKYGVDNAKRVYLKFTLGEGKSKTTFNCLANVVLVYPKNEEKTLYEYRVSFSDIEESARENIVKFVFEEERRKRKKY